MKFDRVMNMKNLLVLCALTLSAQSAFPQMKGGLKFDKLVHDFGNIKEEMEKASTVFTFTNISNVPLVIVKVETSCGCTTPEYTKDTVYPGKSGFVKAIYETRGRHGGFHKNLYVHFNREEDYQSLMISGYVIPEANLANKPKSYTTTYSNLAFNSTIAEFPGIKNTETQTYKIKAFNFMGYPIRIYEVSEKPDYVTIDIGDSLIDVNDSIVITVTVDGTKVPLLGESRKRIGLLTDDPDGSTKFLYVYTNLKEDFSKLSKKELKNAPSILLEPAGTIQLGTHTAGKKFTHTIKIKNTGKSDLSVRDVVPNCSCITAKASNKKVKPGESVNLVFTIDTVNQTIAEHTKYVTLYSNDPVNPEIRIKLLIKITN